MPATHQHHDSRQKKYADAVRMSTEVVAELKNEKDEYRNLGLAYSRLGTLFEATLVAIGKWQHHDP